MAKRTANGKTPEGEPERPAERSTKVTYSLPAALVRELSRRAAGRGRTKSAIVGEAVAFYFAEQDKQALAAVYAEAARDPLFVADNAEIMRDFGALDDEGEVED
jgi:predicted transcriptional regulator